MGVATRLTSAELMAREMTGIDREHFLAMRDQEGALASAKAQLSDAELFSVRRGRGRLPAYMLEGLRLYIHTIWQRPFL